MIEFLDLSDKQELQNNINELDNNVNELKGDLSEIETTTATKENVNDINSHIGMEYVEVESSVSYTEYEGFYINTDGKIRSITNTNFRVRKYQIAKGEKFHIFADAFHIAASYPCVAFSSTGTIENYATTDEIILSATATDASYDEDYTATQNGSIIVALYFTTYSYLNVNKYGQQYAPSQSIKIQLFGDSITDNTWGDEKTWANLIYDFIRNKNVTVVNNAIGGTPLVHRGDNQGVYDLICVDDYRVLDTDNDVIVIMAGTNDWAGVNENTGDNLGSWETLTNKYTIYGALKQIIEYITSSTTAKLIVCTPPQRYNAADKIRETDSKGTPLNYNGKTLREFADAIMDVCRYYGIMCIDMNSILGWNRFNIDNFTTDGLHPNDEGDKWIGHIICNEIKRHCTDTI